MLHYEAARPDGKKIFLPAPLSIRLDFEESTPADALDGVFPFDGRQGPLTRLAVKDEDTILFDGIVDEETYRVSETGAFLELSARSRAALLLDNEAAPQIVPHPSLKLLAAEHAAPYGFAVQGDLRSFREPYAVEKGVSEWQALADFCSRYLKTSLYAQGDTLTAGPRSPQREVVFGTGGTACCASRLTYAYCRAVSALFVRSPCYSNYGKQLIDKQAQDLGIRRRRFVQEKEGGPSAAQRLEAARDASFLLRVVHAGPPVVSLGDGAVFTGKALGAFNGLRVTRVEYRLDRTGERTAVHLRKRRT